MKTLHIQIVDWWDNNHKNNYFLKFLSQYYDVKISKDPDYILCSSFGYDHIKYDCVKILFLGENIVPDFNFYDYAMGFNYIDFEDRYLRYPLFISYKAALQKAMQKHLNINEQTLLSRDFCSFVVSNDCAGNIRREFFEKLGEKYFIASGGRYKNNVGGPVKNKLDFIQKYKFNIAFENSSTNGYCTEKLIEALGAQTLPIYYGDPTLSQNLCDKYPHFINPKSFINIQDFQSIQEAIEWIDEVNKNPNLYLNYLKEPAFVIENIEDYYKAKLKDFFDNIFQQDISTAFRIPDSQWNRTYKKRYKSGTMHHRLSRDVKKFLKGLFKH